MKKFFCLLSLSVCLTLECFTSVVQTQKFAASAQEWVDIDAYSHIYRQLQGWRLFRFFNLFSPQASFFRSLQLVTNQRKDLGLWGRFVLRLSPAADSRLIILSNVGGELHSFLRIISDLQRQGILSDTNMLSSRDYLILNGNMIGDSPYNIQLLDLILSLLASNPFQVFYIRGMQEDKEYWKEYALGAELSFLFPSGDSEQNQIRDFFNTLPLGIYFHSSHIKDGPLRISYFGLEDNEFNHISCKKRELHIGSTSAKGRCGIHILELGDWCSHVQGSLSGLISGVDRNIDWQSMKGLQWDKNSSSWYVVSSPTRFYRQNHGFLFDAYVLLELKKPSKSILSLYLGDRKTGKFSREMECSLTQGKCILP